MSPGHQLLAFAALAGWTAMWWLAVRIVFGRASVYFDAALAAVLAFAVPFMMVELNFATDRRVPDYLLLASWGIVALVTDCAWAASRLRRWTLRRRTAKI
jgi:hypothetical protein